MVDSFTKKIKITSNSQMKILIMTKFGTMMNIEKSLTIEEWQYKMNCIKKEQKYDNIYRIRN